MKINILYTIILIFTSHTSIAQIFDNSQAHSKIKWKQINTPEFRLIFPENFEKAAPTLAYQLQNYLNTYQPDLNRKARKTPIIVQQNNIDQNGFVQLAPRKSEFYSTPSNIADNQPWLSNLALHEVRHIAQFDNLTGKINSPLTEQLALALFGINLPSWYFEGDATLQETLFSAGGRGRLSSWQMPIRANIQSDLDFNFNKYVHGSFKDIIPSYYTIGYFMNSQLHQKDPNIAGKILEEMNGKLLRPFNFQRSLKKFYGAKASSIFDETMQNLKVIFGENVNSFAQNLIEFDDKYPTNYLLPQVVNETIFSIESGPQKTNRIIAIDRKTNNTKKEIITLGVQLAPYYDIQEHLVTWDELRRNARFDKETYNVINVYNRATKEKKTITYETRYYNPTIAPNLQEIALVEVDLANQSALVTLDILTGKKIKSIKMADGLHIQQPKYNELGTEVICIGVSELGTNLIKIDLTNDEITKLLDWSNIHYERPEFYKDQVIFKANFNNKDDIFTWKDGEIFQLTNSKFGIFNPKMQNETLYYNDYTTEGYKINYVKIDDLTPLKIAPKPVEALYKTQPRYQNLEELTLIDSSKYIIQDYHTLAHSLNFHSLSLSGNDFESFENLKPGIFWLSNDVLNTMRTKIGFEYNNETRKTKYSAELTYQKYYPKFTITYQNRGQIGSASRNNNPDSVVNFDWRENLVALDMQIPFTKYRGNNTYSYGFNFGTSYLKRYDVSIKTLQNFNKDILFPLNYQVYFNKNTLRSAMDITPRWGQNFSFTYRHLPFENDLTGISWSLRTNFYFPGFALNHGLQVRFAMQENTGRFSAVQEIPLVQGFSYIPFERVKNTLLLDYRLPIAYPDWSIGQLAYIKRIRGVVSTDFLNVHSSNGKPNSYGVGLSLDFNIFKYNLPEFSFDTKISYLSHSKSTQTFLPTFGINYSY